MHPQAAGFKHNDRLDNKHCKTEQCVPGFNLCNPRGRLYVFLAQRDAQCGGYVLRFRLDQAES